MKFTKLTVAMVAVNLVAISAAHATNGYFAHGFGVKAQGMAGVGIALPQDGLAAATNPAGTAFVGDRLDLGVTYFRPSRGAEISGSMTPGLNGSYDGDKTENYFIPEIGYTKQLSSQLGVGIAIYGNGGMATDYETSPFNPFSPTGPVGSAGVDLSQLFISPSLAYKVNENHALGVAVNFAYQRFRADGIQPFTGFSQSPDNMTNQGYDSSTGWGVRLGYTGKITPDVTLGLTWASKTYMSKMDKYKGLFAEQGDFDIPSNYGLGLAWKATSNLTLAADIQRILYSDVKAVGNSFDFASLMAGGVYGSDNGPGFGWKDVTVGKLGLSYTTGDWTLRTGYSYATQPVPESQTFMNILAPGVVQQHLSFGATWAQGKTGELSVGYTHAFKKTVKGSGSIPVAFGGGEADVHLSEDILGVAYGWKF